MFQFGILDWIGLEFWIEFLNFDFFFYRITQVPHTPFIIKDKIPLQNLCSLFYPQILFWISIWNILYLTCFKASLLFKFFTKVSEQFILLATFLPVIFGFLEKIFFILSVSLLSKNTFFLPQSGFLSIVSNSLYFLITLDTVFQDTPASLEIVLYELHGYSLKIVL